MQDFIERAPPARAICALLYDMAPNVDERNLNLKRRLFAGGALAFLVSCGRLGIGTTKIADLLANPQKFSGREVVVSGTVTNVLKLPFLTTSLYTIRDASGEIVVSSSREPPLVGAELHVKGALDTVATIGSQNIGVHFRETERW